MKVKVSNVNQPNWLEVTVHANLPANLKEAVDLMLEDKVVCDTLGSHIISQYSAGKYAEWDAYRTSVSEWEINEYLMMY